MNPTEIKLAGTRRITFLGLMGAIALGVATWRSSWVAFAVGITCWLMAVVVTLIAIGVLLIDEYAKKAKADKGDTETEAKQ